MSPKLKKSPKKKRSPKQKKSPKKKPLKLKKSSFFSSLRRRKKVRIRHVTEVYEEPIRVVPKRPRWKFLKPKKSAVRVIGPAISADHEKELLLIGWVPASDGYKGYLVFRGELIEGRLKRRYGREYQIYLLDPSMEAFNKHDVQCLNYSGRGWYYVHMEKGKDGNGSPIALLNCVQDKLSKYD